MAPRVHIAQPVHHERLVQRIPPIPSVTPRVSQDTRDHGSDDFPLCSTHGESNVLSSNQASRKVGGVSRGWSGGKQVKLGTSWTPCKFPAISGSTIVDSVRLASRTVIWPPLLLRRRGAAWRGILEPQKEDAGAECRAPRSPRSPALASWLWAEGG